MLCRTLAVLICWIGLEHPQIIADRTVPILYYSNQVSQKYMPALAKSLTLIWFDAQKSIKR